MIVYLLVSLFLSLLGFFLLGRLLFQNRILSATNSSPLSIIIPARNEEDNLPRLLKSIHAQGLPGIEIIVVDDGSTDATAQRAREQNATVLPAPPLPAEWRGKTWACFQGARAAANPTLLFLDADTWFEPNGLTAILQQFSLQSTVLSVLPYHVVRKPYESLSAFFQLITAASTSAFALPHLMPTGLFGQMLLIDREIYFSVGGHEAVKSEVLENFHLASHLRKKNTSLRCAIGKNALSMRMYPQGLNELIAGWTKAFAAGAAQTPKPILLIIIGWLSGLSMCVSALFSFPGILSACVYAVAALKLFIFLRKLGSFPLLAAIFYPIPLFGFFVLFARALTRRQVSWKGRTFDAAG